MSTAEVINWLAHYIYLNPVNKKSAPLVATEIVNRLIDKGVLITTDATPTAKRETTA